VSLSSAEYIRHILDEIEFILSRTLDTDYESFVRDETLKRAFVISMEIILQWTNKAGSARIRLITVMGWPSPSRRGIMA